MKRSTFFITIISLLIPLFGMSQSRGKYIDDIYIKPSDARNQISVQSQNQQPSQQVYKKTTPNFKNGAKEIVYTDKDNTSKVARDTVYVVGASNENRRNTISANNSGHDTVYVVGEANDNTESYPQQEQGYYLNGFKGTESDMEYAERIRHFHNPKYEINIADPRYNDIYFLNDYDWNVYIDGMYAYVTPTWTNPAWWDYTYNPYSYSNWGFGYNNFYSPFSCYSDWYDYPWGFDNFYGGFGNCGYGYGFGFGYGLGFGYGCGLGYGYGYGFGYPYYRHGYYNNWGNNWYGQGFVRNASHEEGTRRNTSNLSASSRIGGNSSQTTIGGGRYASTNPYTVIRGTQTAGSKPSGIRRNPSNGFGNGIGIVRSGGLRNLSGTNQSGARTTRITYSINTSPRTIRNFSTSNSGNQTIMNSGYYRSNYNNYSSGSRISPNYSTRSSSSFNNYSNSGGSRSSGSFSGGGSSGGSSGGSRSSGGGGGGSRR